MKRVFKSILILCMFIEPLRAQELKTEEVEETRTDKKMKRYVDLAEEYDDEVIKKEINSMKKVLGERLKELEKYKLVINIIRELGNPKSIKAETFVNHFIRKSQEERRLVRDGIFEIIRKTDKTGFSGTPYYTYQGQKEKIEAKKKILSLQKNTEGLYQDEEVLEFFSTGGLGFVNLLTLSDYAVRTNRDWKELYWTSRKSSQEVFFNSSLPISILSILNFRSYISVGKWNISLRLKKIVRDVEKLKSKFYDEIKSLNKTLFLPPEVLDSETSKIAIVVNTCSWSENLVTLEDTHQTLTYENYALEHIKSIAKFLTDENRVLIGFINGMRYGYYSELMNRENFENYISVFKDFKDLEYSINRDKKSRKGVTNSEGFGGFYSNTVKNNYDFDFVISFTDGYAKDHAIERLSMEKKPSTVFIFKAMYPEEGSFDTYVQNVARKGKDIVLNKRYFAPHYIEYKAKKAAIDILDQIITEIDQISPGE